MSGMGWMEISERTSYMSTAVLMNTCMQCILCMYVFVFFFRSYLSYFQKKGECLLLDAPTVIN